MKIHQTYELNLQTQSNYFYIVHLFLNRHFFKCDVQLIILSILRVFNVSIFYLPLKHFDYVVLKCINSLTFIFYKWEPMYSIKLIKLACEQIPTNISKCLVKAKVHWRDLNQGEVY